MLGEKLIFFGKNLKIVSKHSLEPNYYVWLIFEKKEHLSWL